MSKIQRVFLDTAPVIYYIQQNEIYFEQVKQIFLYLLKEKALFVSSDITTAEACVYPYKLGRLDWIKSLDEFIKVFKIKVISTSDLIAKKSAQIRARYDKFKAMDSLQLATAVLENCDIFLTNDKRLRQFDEIECVTVSEFFNQNDYKNLKG